MINVQNTATYTLVNGQTLENVNLNNTKIIVDNTPFPFGYIQSKISFLIIFVRF